MATGDIRLISVDATNGPNFEIDINGNNLRYKIEIATEFRLLRANEFHNHTPQNYFSTGIILSPTNGTLSWSLPPGVWGQLRGSLNSEGRIYCRVSILGAGVNVRNPAPGQEANAPSFSTSITPEAVFFTGLDTEQTVDHAMAWNHIRLKLTFPTTGSLPTTAQATLVSTRTGESLRVNLEKENTNSRNFVSEPIYLHGSDGDIPSVFARIHVGYSDVLTVTVENRTRNLEIRDFGPLPVPASSGRFILTSTGPLTVTIDPAQNQTGSIAMRMTGPGSEPVEGANIIWRIEGHTAAFITTTDENGITNLEFIPDKKGKFSVLTEGLLLGEGINRGRQTITALPEDNMYYMLLEQMPPQFTVNLIAPTSLSFLMINGDPYSYIVSGDDLYFEINLGDAEMSQYSSPPASIDVRLTDFESGVQTVTLTREVYDYKFVSRTAIRLTSNFTNNNGNPVTLSFRNHQVQLPFYIYQVDVPFYEGRKALAELHRVVIAALQSPSLSPEQRTVLNVKLGLIDNALTFLHAPYTSSGLPAAIASKYLELLSYPVERLGAVIDIPANNTPLPAVIGTTSIRYIRTVEKNELDSIFRHWIATGNWIVFNSVMVLILEAVKVVLSPLIGAYVAISGKTIEGKNATFLERVLGGVDAMLSLIPVAMAISRYGKAAKAYRRKMGFDDVRTGNLKLGQMIERTPFSVPPITGANALTELTQAFSITITRESTDLRIAFFSNKNIEKLQGTLRRHRNNLTNKRAELDNLLQREINNGPSPELTDEINWTRERINTLENDYIPKNQAKLRHERQRNREATRRLDELHVGREMAREELEFLRDEGLIPGAHDKFVGTPANRLYEFQLNEQLINPNSSISAATGWTSAQPRQVVVPYRPTRWGTRPDFSVGSPMRSLPRPDHVNIDINDLRAGDSKYFTFWPDEALTPGTDLLSNEFIKDRVDQMVNTIEKGRLVQYTEIRGLMPGQPPSAIWNQVFDKEFYIFTPVDVPQRVQNVVKNSVMGAGRNLRFITVPADLDAWLRAL